jgi:hypothetical protein
MDATMQAVVDFIGGRVPGVASFLTSVNAHGDAYIRQVGSFVERDERGWRLGTIGRIREGDLKMRHLSANPRATVHWVEVSGATIGPRGAARNVWVQGDVELVRDPARIAAFLERRAAARGVPPVDADYERYVIEITPRRLRAEGFLELYREVLVLTDFANPDSYRTPNYRSGVSGAEVPAAPSTG